MVVKAMLEVPKSSVDVAVRTRAEKNELAAAIEAVWDGVENQVNAFLVIEAADEGDNGTKLFSKPERIAKSVFVGVFILNRLDGITSGDVRVGLGIPDIVIEPVQNAAEFSLVRCKNSLQAHTEMPVTDFISVARRNRGDEIGIDDAAFHEINRAMAMIVGKAIVGHDASRTQADLAKDLFAVNPLMAEVVKCETDPRVAHAEVLIDLVKEHGDERRLPVMAMNNVGMLVRFEHELQCCPAEKGETFRVIMMTVEDASIEKAVVGMRIDEETFQALHEAEVYIAPNPLVVVGDPEIAIGFGQTPDAVVAHAIVFGQDDFDCVSANAKLPGEALDNIAEAADFCGRSTFGRDHYDVHGV